MDFLSRELALWAGPTGWELAVWRAPSGLAVTLVFALLARLLSSVTRGGATAGAAVTLAIWIAWPPAFLVVFAVFLLTAISTRIGYAHKTRRGTAEPRAGRSATQVLANLVVAAAAALFAQFGHQVLAFAACAAAFAEAACDTVSSEIGQAFSARAWLVTSFRRVPAGMDGGISAIGTLAGAASSLAVAAAAAVTRTISWDWLPAVALAGFAGMLFDSLLGATLQRRRLLNNSLVNLLGTAFAALLVLLFV